MNHVRLLITGLRDTLQSVGLSALTPQLPDETDESPVRVAFVGAYNAGKSTLIADLTRDLAIKRDSKPQTSEVGHYPWPEKELMLVDVPGWFSGFAEHDAVADAELRRNADLVAFVLTVELGDENNVEALALVLDELGFENRCLVVVNKANAEDHDEQVIRDEVQARLGRHSRTPVVFTDAQDYFDTISNEFELAPDDAAVLRADSGILQLEAAILDLANLAQHARQQAQAEQARRVIGEALLQLVPDTEEQAAEAIVIDLDRTIEAHRRRLDKVFAAEREQLELELRSLAEVAVAALDGDAKKQEAADAQVQQRWDELVTESLARLNQAFTRESEQLAIDTEVTLDVLPLSDLAPRNPVHEEGAPGGPSLLRRMLSALDVKVEHVTNPIKQEIRKVASGGSGAGSDAYAWARKLQPDKKFAPHGRLKDAEKLRKAAATADRASKFTPAAVPVVNEAYKWFKEQKSESARRKAVERLGDVFRISAQDTGADLAAQYTEWVAESFAPVYDKLRSFRQPLSEAQRKREDERLALTRLDSSLAEALSSLATSQPPG